MTPSHGYEPSLAISVQNLTKEYGTGESRVKAVDGISFDIEPGTVVGLLGPNGAGKTTTIKMLLGLVTPTAGRVQIAEEDIVQNQHEIYNHVGAMLEGARNIYWRLTVRENLAFFAQLCGFRLTDVQERHQQLIEQFDLAEKADEPVSSLSRGMKQRASLICTLSRQTEIVLLDEPTLGLDLENSIELRREIRRLAEREAMTVVLSSHDMDLVEAICDRIIVMHEGTVIADDNVENLVDIFQVQSYRVIVESPFPERLRAELNRTYETHNWTQSTEHVQFDVVLQSGSAFYDFISALQAADVTLLSARSLESDLGDVFLELIDRSEQNGPVQEGQ